MLHLQLRFWLLIEKMSAMTRNDGIPHLEQAIISVLSGQNIAAANEYILKFVETDQSWTASMMLCTQRSDNDSVRYFAANILYSKVKYAYKLVLHLT